VKSSAIKKNAPVAEARPDVYSYEDYKMFLRDYLHYLKESDSGFSMRKIALQSKTSVGYLPTILNTDQDITEKAVEKLVPHLQLDREESSYFKILCSINASTPQEERIEALKKLQRFSKYSRLNPNQSLVTQYLSKWYYVAIREMANNPEFKMDAGWVQSQLNYSVPIADVSRALEFLFRNNLIKIETNGKFKATDERVVGEGNIFRFILTHFHKQVFELALKAIDITDRQFRSIRGHTMSLNKENYRTARTIMDKALEDIAALPETPAKDNSVYHFLFTGFPMSKVKKEDE
jgi:uncharacterized protein (TIGR02147 family)